ncbi:uncharacterized protein EI97DRAFT_485417, partial [Westerdykella ornata]
MATSMKLSPRSSSWRDLQAQHLLATRAGSTQSPKCRDLSSTAALQRLLIWSSSQTGWESLKMAKALSYKTEYMCYVRMQASDSPGLYLGDGSLFHGDEAIAVATGLKFHEVRKENLHKVLPGSRNLSGRTAARDPPLAQSPVAVRKENISPASQPVARQKSQPSRPSRIERAPQTSNSFPKVLGVLSQEIGVRSEELANDAAFENLGIDSLLTISIGSRLKDELQPDLPLTLFTECATVSQLRDFFQKTVDA